MFLLLKIIVIIINDSISMIIQFKVQLLIEIKIIIIIINIILNVFLIKNINIGLFNKNNLNYIIYFIKVILYSGILFKFN